MERTDADMMLQKQFVLTLRETGIEQIQKKNSGHFWTVLVLNKYSTLTTKQRFLPDSKFSNKGLPF